MGKSLRDKGMAFSRLASRPMRRRARAGAAANDLIRATDGVALVETALVMPFLALVVMGTVDAARYGAAKLAVQQAVNRGLEMSMMAGPDGITTSDIQAQAAAQAGVSTSAVTVTQTLECSGAATSWSSTCSTGETARYTQIQISTTFTPTFVLGMMAKLYGNSNGVIPIAVTGAMRIQ